MDNGGHANNVSLKYVNFQLIHPLDFRIERTIDLYSAPVERVHCTMINCVEALAQV